MSILLTARCDWKRPRFFFLESHGFVLATHTAPTTRRSALLAVSAAILGVQLAIQAIVHVRHAQGQEPQIASAIWNQGQQVSSMESIYVRDLYRVSPTNPYPVVWVVEAMRWIGFKFGRKSGLDQSIFLEEFRKKTLKQPPQN